MNVLVVAEDFGKDQFVLKPVLSRLFAMIGRRRANVDICRDPLLRGVDEALKSRRIAEIVRQHGGMTDIFVLCVDSDEGRRQRLDQIEDEFGRDRAFLVVNASEEVETWLLAGLNLPSDWRWSDVRAEIHVKERYFDPLARERGTADGPGGGRGELGREAARRVHAIRRKCPEDFGSLARRLQVVVQDQ